jgi:predicted methyltransferase
MKETTAVPSIARARASALICADFTPCIFATLIVCIFAALSACSPSGRSAQAAPLDQDKYRRPDLVLAALKIAPGSTIADVGAGSGYLTHRLAAEAGAHGRVTATDIDAGQLARIGAAAPGEAPIATRVVSPDDPGLEPGAYDLILLSEVDHLLADRAAYLRKLVPALKAGGRIALSNRRVHLEPLMAAVERAGLSRAGAYEGLPAHFLIQVRP